MYFDRDDSNRTRDDVIQELVVLVTLSKYMNHLQNAAVSEGVQLKGNDACCVIEIACQRGSALKAQCYGRLRLPMATNCFQASAEQKLSTDR
jgi:tRNA threonylcarbamoyladenosine modification (KEOPS) complex  Pcc1 subunit